MKKVKIGVLGAKRGSTMVKYCRMADNAEVVAVCDKSPKAIEREKAFSKGFDITYYEDFDEFLKHDMDAVVLANYANEHAPFAIKAMKAGKHVFSDVVPCQTMKEAVELIEAVEETGMIYAYGENFCYMAAPYEMKKLYAEGKIGEFEYGECEYVHNCEKDWPRLTYGEKDHWRNNLYSSFYCTHSLGPIIHATGLRPVSVIGIEGTKNERHLRVGSKGGQFAIEMVTLENGGIVKSLHGGLYYNSHWYSMYGSKGRMECARPDSAGKCNGVNEIFVMADKFSGEYNPETHWLVDNYEPKREHDEIAEYFPHDGSDFYMMYHFVEKINGNKDADIIDVYEAMDMYLPGMFAYRSILAGNIPMELPNLRNKEERDKWRNDVACTDPKVAGDQVLPTFSLGTPEIDDAIYEKIKEQWEEAFQKEKENNFITDDVLHQDRTKK